MRTFLWARSRAFELGVAACAGAAAAFLLARLNAWPPHEDETLALFVGRAPIDDLLDIVLGERGGAPLHFVLAWAVAHTGGGLFTLRVLSALFAVASIPLVAALSARLAGRTAALAATAIVSASWILLLHGIYARMYSVFLFLSLLSYLLLLRALERGTRGAWIGWAVATLLVIASHPYGALVLASQAAYVALTRSRLKAAVVAFAAVIVLAAPFWRANLVLAERFDVGVGGGGKLGSPRSVLDYLYSVAGDATTGYTPVLVPVLLLAAFGLRRMRDRTALLALSVAVVPACFFLLGRFGSSTSPESRHLIFAVPFLAAAVGAGLAAVARRPAIAALAVAALIPAEIAWGWEKTPLLYEGEAPVRVGARTSASRWLAASTRRDDILFGYEPLFLAAWERSRGSFPRNVVPRADPKLALRQLRKTARPLGRGVWVFDAGDTNNFVQRDRIDLRLPFPRGAFEGRVYGPYLIIRTTRPTLTVERYLDDARKVQLIGKSLELGDADVNYATITAAAVQNDRAILARASP